MFQKISLTPTIFIFGIINAIFGGGIVLITSDENYKSESMQMFFVILLMVWITVLLVTIFKVDKVASIANIYLAQKTVSKIAEANKAAKRRGRGKKSPDLFAALNSSKTQAKTKPPNYKSTKYQRYK